MLVELDMIACRLEIWFEMQVDGKRDRRLQQEQSFVVVDEVVLDVLQTHAGWSLHI